MLMAMALGAFFAWSITKLVVSKWKKGWVAVLTVAILLPILFIAGMMLAIWDRNNSRDGAGMDLVIFGGFFWTGVFVAIKTAYSTVKKPQLEDSLSSRRWREGTFKTD